MLEAKLGDEKWDEDEVGWLEVARRGASRRRRRLPKDGKRGSVEAKNKAMRTIQISRQTQDSELRILGGPAHNWELSEQQCTSFMWNWIDCSLQEVVHSYNLACMW